MKPRRKISLAVICAVELLCFACVSPALATTLARLSLAQMARAAQEIVRAQCVGNSVGWDEGEIWTFTTFRVEETWRGGATGQITVRLLGGRTGQLTSIVSGVPRFTPGEEVVLFLQRTSHGDFSVVSWQQGTFRIRRNSASGEETVTQDTASLDTFDPATRHFAMSGIHTMPIARFRVQIETAVSTASRETINP
jgi:hypothetical protein